MNVFYIKVNNYYQYLKSWYTLGSWLQNFLKAVYSKSVWNIILYSLDYLIFTVFNITVTVMMIQLYLLVYNALKFAKSYHKQVLKIWLLKINNYFLNILTSYQNFFAYFGKHCLRKQELLSREVFKRISNKFKYGIQH